MNDVISQRQLRLLFKKLYEVHASINSSWYNPKSNAVTTIGKVNFNTYIEEYYHKITIPFKVFKSLTDKNIQRVVINFDNSFKIMLVRFNSKIRVIIRDRITDKLIDVSKCNDYTQTIISLSLRLLYDLVCERVAGGKSVKDGILISNLNADRYDAVDLTTVPWVEV